MAWTLACLLLALWGLGAFGVGTWRLVATADAGTGDRPAPASPPARPVAAAVAPAALAERSVLSVQLLRPRQWTWPQDLQTTGNLASRQEMVIAAPTPGGQLAQVTVQVGDKVRPGQVLASLNSQPLQLELAQLEASAAEAQVALVEASSLAERVRGMPPGGALSAQQIQQHLAAEQMARARWQAQSAAVKAARLRLDQATVRAPDGGVIAQRLATPGALVQPGQELFRLIRQGRLEWRAELPSASLSRVVPGQAAQVTLPDGRVLAGTVRLVGPTVDVASRNGLVYVDLPPSPGAMPGMFATGVLRLPVATGLAVPATAVLLRDGVHQVFTVTPEGRAKAQPVTVGRRVGDWVEIIQGVSPATDVVAQGLGFIEDGQRVQVLPRGVNDAPAPPVAAP